MGGEKSEPSISTKRNANGHHAEKASSKQSDMPGSIQRITPSLPNAAFRLDTASRDGYEWIVSDLPDKKSDQFPFQPPAALFSRRSHAERTRHPLPSGFHLQCHSTIARLLSAYCG